MSIESHPRRRRRGRHDAAGRGKDAHHALGAGVGDGAEGERGLCPEVRNINFLLINVN